MDSSSVLVTFASLIVGWFFNEMAKKFQMSRERRAHVGRALSNLLELHHQVRSVENTIHTLMHHFTLPKDQEPVMRAILVQLIPQGEECVERYEEAIDQLSESDPLIAFDLRTKAQIPRFIATLKTMDALQGTSEVDMVLIEKKMKSLLLPYLEVAIQELASLHGRSTLRQVKRMLNAPFVITVEMNEFIQQAQAAQEQQITGDEK